MINHTDSKSRFSNTITSSNNKKSYANTNTGTTNTNNNNLAPGSIISNDGNVLFIDQTKLIQILITMLIQLIKCN
jgi:hypothetical protein